MNSLMILNTHPGSSSINNTIGPIPFTTCAYSWSNRFSNKYYTKCVSLSLLYCDNVSQIGYHDYTLVLKRSHQLCHQTWTKCVVKHITTELFYDTKCVTVWQTYFYNVTPFVSNIKQIGLSVLHKPYWQHQTVCVVIITHIGSTHYTNWVKQSTESA